MPNQSFDEEMLLYKGVQCIAHQLNQRSKRSEGPPRGLRLDLFSVFTIIGQRKELAS